MHPSFSSLISQELHREKLARAERHRLARAAARSRGNHRNYLPSWLARLASWARDVADWRPRWAPDGTAQPGLEPGQRARVR